MPAGRPTDYDPSYCEKVIEWGKQGKSRTWMAARLGTHRQRLYVWEEAHPEFRDALMHAKALEQLWWEDKGQECLVMAQGSTFSQSAWSRSMAARFPDEWREKVGHVGGNEDDKPIRTETTHHVLDEFSSRMLSLSARINKGSGDREADGGST